jgi:ankyrin repeat protein
MSQGDRKLLIYCLALVTFVVLPFWVCQVEFAIEYGDPKLVRAAAMGDAARVRVFLERGSPVNSYHMEGSSALWWAVYGGSLETVELLLRYGAEVNSRGQFQSVIETAVEQLRWEDDEPRRAIAQALLARAAKIKDPAQVRLLKEAVARK